MIINSWNKMDFLNFSQNSSSVLHNLREHLNQYYVYTEIPAVVHLFNHYIVPATCLFGVLGNLLLLLYFLRASVRLQPCSQYWTALVCVDTLFLITKLLLSSMTRFTLLRSRLSCQLIIYLSYNSSFLSAWFVVFMMAEKTIVVCVPLRASRVCTRKKSILVMISASALSMILYSYSFFTIGHYEGECVVSSYWYNFLTIVTYLDSCIVFVVPFVGVVALNATIILVLRGMRLHHNVYNRNQEMAIRRPSLLQNCDLNKCSRQDEFVELQRCSSQNGERDSSEYELVSSLECVQSHSEERSTSVHAQRHISSPERRHPASHGKRRSSKHGLRFHNSTNTLNRAQIKSTKILVLVSTIFIILHLPSYAVRLYGMVLEFSEDLMDTMSDYGLYAIQSVVQFLYCLKFGVGSVVYFIATSRMGRRRARVLYNCKRNC
ncbi:uncharacterized protein LOC106056042 [Biomphalaria glabrata]|uniref:Uncharacterized protein LOC106056042 n=1 Tax=Biomphalaria glabrata TaxID=6526 RepID=A0A9U8E076_BIOGL|nr:uncharacterized protein LOC106056042 [Biomphalaria glabrata]